MPFAASVALWQVLGWTMLLCAIMECSGWTVLQLPSGLCAWAGRWTARTVRWVGSREPTQPRACGG